MRASCFVLITKYYLGDQMEKNEMGRACSGYGERRGAYRVWWGIRRPRRRLEDNIEINLQEIGWSEGRDRWRAVVYAVTNLRVA
jgi:hypothetical protein